MINNLNERINREPVKRLNKIVTILDNKYELKADGSFKDHF
jgi:hypothetical protein